MFGTWTERFQPWWGRTGNFTVNIPVVDAWHLVTIEIWAFLVISLNLQMWGWYSNAIQKWETVVWFWEIAQKQDQKCINAIVPKHVKEQSFWPK